MSQGRDESASSSSAAPADERATRRRTILDRVLQELPDDLIDALTAEGFIELRHAVVPHAASATGGSDHLNSSPPGEPSAPSKRRYVQPVSASALAAQANEIATSVLNGEIDLEVAALYATTARVAVSAMNIEVQRARAAHTPPRLSLNDAE